LYKTADSGVMPQVVPEQSDRERTLKRRKGWLTTAGLIGHNTAVLRARLERADSKRTLIANNAAFARQVLEDFASISRPKYSLVTAIWFGSFIDVFLLFRIPVGNPLVKALIRHGGPEQLRFLYCVATFDADRDGKIDDREWANYEKMGDMLIADSVAMCSNMGIVGALLLGLTHLLTMGRPTAYELSEASKEIFQDWVLWLAYSFNAGSECGAFFTLAIAVITRNNLTNILPTRELKVDMLRSSNALGIMGVSLMITLYFFLLSAMFGTLVASPEEGLVGSACFVCCLVACLYFIAPIRYMAVLLLHEEVKRFMIDKSGSFLKQVSDDAVKRGRASSFCRTVLTATVRRHREDRRNSSTSSHPSGCNDSSPPPRRMTQPSNTAILGPAATAAQPRSPLSLSADPPMVLVRRDVGDTVKCVQIADAQ